MLACQFDMVTVRIAGFGASGGNADFQVPPQPVPAANDTVRGSMPSLFDKVFTGTVTAEELSLRSTVRVTERGSLLLAAKVVSDWLSLEK